MSTYFMQKPGLFAAFFGVVALALLPSCQDEDFGFTTDEIRQEVYNRNFKEIFGDVDPDHNWSMAQNVKVNINVPGANGYRLRILTEAPTNREAIVLYHGEMSSDQLSVNVDVVRGTHKLYVELKSDFGIFLVDGYYQIDDEGRVEVNKSLTRAGGSVPNCVNYTQTLTRWARIWDSNRSVPSTYQWDWGFAAAINRLVNGNVNQIPQGWQVTYDGVTRQVGSNYDGGPRIFEINNQSTAFGQNVSKSLFLRKTGTVAQFGGFDGKYIYLSGGPVVVHLALAKRKNQQDDLKVSMVRIKDDGTEVVVCDPDFRYFTSNDPGDGSTKIDFDDKNFSFNAQAGRYVMRIEITNGDNSEGTSFAGFRIEAKDPDSTVEDAWGFHRYNESIDCYISYRDVRGGAVNKLASAEYLQLRNEGTYRYNARNDHFLYRTYDVEKMVDDKGNSVITEGVIGPIYIIDGDNGEAIRTGFENVMYRDIFPLYGMYQSTKTNSWKGAPFREGVNHIDPFFTDEGFHQATDMEMAHDAQIVTLGAINTEKVKYDGSVSIKLVGKGTDHGNDVGYFYYPKSEESKVMDIVKGKPSLNFNKVPKIIIRKGMEKALEGQQVSNLTSSDQIGAESVLWSFQFNRYVDGCFALNLPDDERTVLKNSELYKERYDKDEYGIKTFLSGMEDNPSRISTAANATFKAPIYKLPYYGWDFNTSSVNPQASTTATYVWPKDMVIGFFGIRTDGETAAELSRIYTSSASVELNYFNDLPRGSAFSYKGKNYIGLEDEWDYDNNDFLFEIIGVQSVDPDITPEDDVTTTKVTQDWIIACEDLGGVWDYDFNDLVWAVTKEVNTTTTVSGTTGETTEVGTTDLYFRALAAGGTLEAIVEYNPSMELDTSTDNDDSHWIQLGEIHNLVKRTSPLKKNDQYETSTSEQLNVAKGTSVKKADVGDRIKLGSTIPTNSSDITMANILTHFRVRVYYPNGTSMIVRNVSNIQSEASQSHNHTTHDTKKDADKTPQFLLLPPGWAWPAEGVCIQDVYGLSSWVQNQNNTTEFQGYWIWRKSNEGKGGAYVTYTLDE